LLWATFIGLLVFAVVDVIIINGPDHLDRATDHTIAWPQRIGTPFATPAEFYVAIASGLLVLLSGLATIVADAIVRYRSKISWDR